MNVFWFKRDLRILDNKALFDSLEKQCIVIYIFEPSVSFNYDWDIRHWRFIYQSLKDLENQGLEVHFLYGEATDIFTTIFEIYGEFTLYSHCETGNDLTFKRDLSLKSLFKDLKVKWIEYDLNLVKRGLKNRMGWDARWISIIKQKIVSLPNLNNTICDHSLEEKFSLPNDLKSNLSLQSNFMVEGGEYRAHTMLKDFLENKVESYWGAISYPDKSKYYCSYLSSYISWGNISIRQIYQACENQKKNVSNKISLNQFMARLKWHCHFIQKLEMEPRIEFENLNAAYNDVRNSRDRKLLKAWKNGQTGYPLIDAAMRCVKETGYLNFRLRSTVVSFLTHILWQPWQSGSGYLARMFLDYEPGIHFSQFQMQAGTTGINTIRIYNPIKQSKEKDKDGIFIKTWVQELENIPKESIHEPWKMTEMEQIMYGVRIGKDYPRPIVDFTTAYQNAKDKLWKIKNSKDSIYHSRKILRKHAR